MAVGEMISSGAVAEWTKPADEPGATLIHDAVFKAAAKVRLTKEGKFPKREFLKEVKRIAAEEPDPSIDC